MPTKSGLPATPRRRRARWSAAPRATTATPGHERVSQAQPRQAWHASPAQELTPTRVQVPGSDTAPCPS